MGKLIYAILSVKNNPEKLNTLLIGLKGISGADLYAIYFNQISAVVSDGNRSGLIADKSGAIEYAGVIEKLVKQFTLLPMRYGSFIESAYTITEMLERNYQEILNNLQKVDNKSEFGLKVFCDLEKLKTELKAKSKTGANIPAKPSLDITNSVYRDWLNKKLKEHRLEELLLTYIDSVISEITRCFARLNTVNKFKKMTTSSIIVDAVFLLKIEWKDSLIHSVVELQNQYPGLNFVITGPWPPYSFVEITLK